MTSTYLYIDKATKNNFIKLNNMKQFFQNLVVSFKNLITRKVNKHQKWLFLSSLIFGLILGLVLGTISTLILMFIFGVLFEAVYYFVPFKKVQWLNYWFNVPDFKEFKTNHTLYLIKPQHEINVEDFSYFYCSLIIFILVRIIFLFF